MLVHALISNRVYYCNSILHRVAAVHLRPFQSVLSAAARARLVVRQHYVDFVWRFSLCCCYSIKKELCDWYCLSVHLSVGPFVCLSFCKQDNSQTCLRMSKNGDYNIPRVLSGFVQRSFSVSGHDAWNSLPRQLRSIAVASTFKRHLKSELFFQAYGVSTIASIPLLIPEIVCITD